VSPMYAPLTPTPAVGVVLARATADVPAVDSTTRAAAAAILSFVKEPGYIPKLCVPAFPAVFTDHSARQSWPASEPLDTTARAAAGCTR
jgi:hypothetical protein